MSDEKRAATAEEENTTARPGVRGSARHRWFPVLVLAAAAAWWIRQAANARYHTFNHFAVALLTVLLVSIWYLACGGARKGIRRAVVGGLWAGVILFLALFEPVYNGDMGIFSWRPRFAPAADELLEQIECRLVCVLH